MHRLMASCSFDSKRRALGRGVAFGELGRWEGRPPRVPPIGVDLDSVELAERAEGWLEDHPDKSFAEALVAVAGD